ncbi:MAG TPA: DUF5666 domain-containing protein [Candidatus Paceibacterota bacterium]|nr:DUF5666 domain-containing protein [Candidatus Paceibacterota bacterium]
MRNLIGLVLMFALGTGTALAANLDESQSHREGGPLIVPAATLNGSANVSVDDRSDDGRGNEHWGVGSTTREDLHKIEQVAQFLRYSTPGTVTSVASTSFVMTVPPGKNHATSTMTVNVSSSTKFYHASSTAGIADLSAGTHVEVFGKVSTSTQSIAAERILIGETKKDVIHAEKGFLERIKDFFGGNKHATSTDATTTDVKAEAHADASASVNRGFIVNLLHSIFGWF